MRLKKWVASVVKRVPGARRVFHQVAGIIEYLMPGTPLADSDIVVITERFNYSAGHTIPIRIILDVLRGAVKLGRDDRLLSVIYVDDVKYWRRLYAEIANAKVVIVNSVSPLLSYRIKKAIEVATAFRRGHIFVYLHEGKYVFDRIISEGGQPSIDLLRKMTIVPLTVELRDEYERSWNWVCTAPVYNSLGRLPVTSVPVRARPVGYNIVTVGSFQPRKGVDRLIRLAETLETVSPGAVTFHWIGPKSSARMGSVPEALPANVIWWGRLDYRHIMHLLPAFDAFLLPSLSDPLPLSVWEALLFDKLCLVSPEVGTSSLGLGPKVKCLDFPRKDIREIAADALAALEAERIAQVGEDGSVRDQVQGLIGPNCFYGAFSKAINDHSASELLPSLQS
ncbi:glycosyltransferase [Pelagibacterium xiamenense]|uniref:glycosyltransferase n=1 Tax=Pelagibacterium xiamenense TaxID=2901140 RepID=UPI001E452350|nr:glycosyltransferase [Pelagibacterium xiamenense]MCD7061406.1 glycosyltransferase [Pelagibacterium xiamenense]